jgi:hypothetical protein
MTRRQFLRTGAAATACPTVAATTSGCSGTHRQEDQARWLRRPLVASTLSTEQFQEIVRCATLAANGHNTQPWRFHLEPDRITISPDFSRRTPAVDPDDHHLWVSLGCATENLVHAARALGKYADVEQTLQDIRISFTNSPPERSSLVDAIFQRQCTRADYDGRQMPSDVLHALEEAGAVNGVGLRLVTDRAQMETVLEYVTAGNSAQMRDPAFVAELKHWIRFDDAEAAESGDGLFTRASGNPTSPSWLGSRMFSLFFTEKSENDKYAKQIRSSAGVAILVGERADPASWFGVGRAYERLALTMTTLGIRNSFLNQPVEVPAVRTQFAQWLGAPRRRPDLVLRFGTGPLLPYSLRRPVSKVIS